MKIKTIILLILFIIGLSYIYLSEDSQNTISNSSIQTKIKIAACPTCFELGKKLDPQKYEIISTSSTSESLNLLQNGQVDMVLAGRTLMPNEPQANYLVIEEGYSFLSSRSMSVYEHDLKNYQIYTDLDIEKIKEKFHVGKITQVTDVYQYSDKGIIITSWENTDFTRAEMIHMLKDNGERMVLARRPTLYCSETCGIEAQETVKSISNKDK